MKPQINVSNGRRGSRGFTLAELLIVIAIIAVLVAIAIPVFSSQLERARDAVTLTNLRTAYAEANMALIPNLGAEGSIITDGGITINFPSRDQPLYDDNSSLIKEEGAIHLTVPGVSLHGRVTGIDIELDLPFGIRDTNVVFNDKPGKYDLKFVYVSKIRTHGWSSGGTLVAGTTDVYEFDEGFFELIDAKPSSDD